MSLTYALDCAADMATPTTERIPTRERRPSMGAPLVDIQGSVSPAGISRPKHKRTFTGFGATEIKSVEGLWQASFRSIAPLDDDRRSACWAPLW